jgi:DNA ligase (NAD+)
LIRRVEYFVGRSAMDIDNFGSRTGALLVEQGLIEDVADIYYLQREDLLALEGFKEKKADNLLLGIQQSTQQPAERVLTALGIRFVGSIVAGLLVNELVNIDEIGVATQESLETIEGIGPETAAAVVAWFDEPKNRILLEKIRAAGLNFKKAQQEKATNSLKGLTFVITGTLSSFTRDEAKGFIESHGGRVTGSVSGRTDYLVAGESAGSKLVKAQKLGVSVLDQEALLRLVDDG